MYIVTLRNGDIVTEIHGEKEKLKSGSVVKGINSIDSFSFSIFPSNVGFSRIHDFQTLVSVYNTRRKRYEFLGRVLYSSTAMDETGHITKEVTCESYFGFFCDSQQRYVEEKNWTVRELLQHIIDTHNSQVEDYKQVTLGEITVEDPNDNLYLGIQRETTWKTIDEKLLQKLGGEIQFRVVDGVFYLDYLKKIGATRATEIALSRNMKAITRENDPSSYVTRLIPLGCKLKKEVTSTDEDGNETTEEVETEERLDISSVNNGVDYIDDVDAVAAYGIHVGYVEWDDVTDAGNLLRKGQEWLAENNKVQIKYSITALDLSLLGLDIDDFDAGNYHPIKNALLGIDDVARIVKKTIDICEEVQSSIEVGDNFKTLSDIQIEQGGKVDELQNTVGKIESDYVTNEVLVSESLAMQTLIQQTMNNILLSVQSEYYSKTNMSELQEVIAGELELFSDKMQVTFTETARTIVEDANGVLQSQLDTITTYFTFDIDGMTIGKIDNPYKVVISNNRYSMMVNGVEVLWFDGMGKGNIPELNVTKTLNLLGLLIDEDETHINCAYVGVNS